MNKQRFWTGISMGLVELVGITIFGLTLIDWSFLTSEIMLMAMVISAVVIYNLLAMILIWNGSKEEKKVNKR